jgi:hypothetical protein
MTMPSVAEPTVSVKDEPDERFFTDAQLCERWQCSPPTLWRKRKLDPRMPRPIKGFSARNITPGAEIRAYERLLLAERDAAPDRRRDSQHIPIPPRKSAGSAVWTPDDGRK